MKPRMTVTQTGVFRMIMVMAMAWLVVLSATIGKTPFASAEALVYENRPVTLHARLVVGDQPEEGYWLAELMSVDESNTAALALAWSEVPVGWFGTVWGLHVVSGAGLLPPQFAAPGQGFLAGTQFHTLTNVAPQPGHTYDITFSYDPRSGAIGTRVYDTTAQEILVEHGLQARPYTELFAIQSDDASAPTLTGIVARETIEHFSPAGLNWRLVAIEANGVMQTTSVIDRQLETQISLRLPWNRLPGELHVWLDNGQESRHLGTMTQIVDQSAVRLSVTDLSAGEYALSLEHVTETESIGLGSLPVRVGVVRSHLEDVEVTLVGQREVAVRGDLVVSGDGPISTATVGLQAGLDRVVLVPAAESNQRVFSTEPETRQYVLATELTSIDQESIHIPFSTTLEITSNLEWPYRIWNVILQPEADAEAADQSTDHQESVRVYAATPPESRDTVSFMSYNIHAGAGMDGRIDLQRLADVMAYSGADVIGLQEVDVRTQRSNGVDQARTLAHLLNMYSAFGYNLPYRGGQFGNAVLSRYPIVSTNNTRLPGLGGETRGILHSVIDVNGTPISFYVTHLSYNAPENDIQREHVVGILRETPRPFILVGDFNVVAGRATDPRQTFDPLVRDAWLEAAELSPPRSPLRTLSSLGYTFNSANPSRRIDYIFLSDRTDLVGEEGVFIIHSQASDHLPLVAEVQLKD